MAGNTRLSKSLARLQPIDHVNGFEPVLHEIVAIYGLKHATCLVVRAGGVTDLHPLFCTTYPPGWKDIYLSRSYFEIDPVVDIIRWARLPVDWSRLQGTSPTIIGFFEEARRHDVGANGLTVPVRGPNGERSLFSVSSDLAQDEWATMCQKCCHDFLILSHCLHDRVMSATDFSMSATVRRLSARERQCLEALASGRLPKQIAATLGISESAVRLYLRSARSKLGATTSCHAVARASLFELIAV